MTTEQQLFIDLHNIMTDPFIGLDTMRMLCGDKIGSGQYRAVYDCKLVENAVVKIAPVKPSANTIEFEVWKKVKPMAFRKWFAECLYISPGGHVLIQRKVEPIPKGMKMPKTLPGFFTDIKRANWGMIGKQIVCHDYQFIVRALGCAMATKINAKWDSRDSTGLNS